MSKTLCSDMLFLYERNVKKERKNVKVLTNKGEVLDFKECDRFLLSVAYETCKGFEIKYNIEKGKVKTLIKSNP